MTRRGQQLRAWPDSSASWTKQLLALLSPLLSTPPRGMKLAARDFSETDSDLLLLWSG
jgi:hypothetical protein